MAERRSTWRELTHNQVVRRATCPVLALRQ